MSSAERPIEPRKRGRKPLLDERREMALVRDYAEGRLLVREIADKHGVSEATAYTYIRKHRAKTGRKRRKAPAAGTDGG